MWSAEAGEEVHTTPAIRAAIVVMEMILVDFMVSPRKLQRR
jgi:hypothetical protein